MGELKEFRTYDREKVCILKPESERIPIEVLEEENKEFLKRVREALLNNQRLREESYRIIMKKY